MVRKLNKFFSEVVVELKKVSWSTRQELLDSTWIVFISAAFLVLFIGMIDVALSKFIGWILGR